MKNRLSGSIAYLAGPIDRAHDSGIQWRLDIQNYLWSLNIGVLNPCDKPMDWGIESESTINERHKLKEIAFNRYKKGLDNHNLCCDIHEQVKKIVAADLRCIDKCDFVILYIDTDVHMCGSYNEQTHACLQRKPVVVCCKQGKFGVPDWLWGICQHDMFFGSWNEVKDYIYSIAFNNNVEHFRRWRFFDMNKVYNREIF